MSVLLTIDTDFIDGAGDPHTGYVNSSWTVSEGAVLAASASNGDILPIKISSNPDGGTITFSWVADASTNTDSLGRGLPDELTIWENWITFGPLIWDSASITGRWLNPQTEDPPVFSPGASIFVSASGTASVFVSAGCERLMLQLNPTSSAAFHVTGMVFTPGTQPPPPPPPMFIPFWTNLVNCEERP